MLNIFFSYFLLFLPSISDVMQRQNWMMPNHARTSVPHNLLDFFFHQRLITVNQTLSTCGFLLLERALIQTHLGVRNKFGAVWARVIFAFMVFFTVNSYHSCNSLFLPSNSWMLTSHLAVPLIFPFRGRRQVEPNKHYCLITTVNGTADETSVSSRTAL